MTGIVSDPGGAVIPGATVQITNTETKEAREASTEMGGRYTISQLRPGTYQLTVTAAGFKRFVRSGIRLQGSQHVEMNVTLELGQVTESVEVRAQAVLPDTQSANQTTSLNSEEITELPVNFRNPLALVLANAGTYREYQPLNSSTGVPADQDFGIFAMNGGRQAANAVAVDGISIKGGDWGATFGTPSVDSVQEMQISRNTYDAEYGRVASGVVSLVTKGGGDRYHGTAFWFLRNDNLDANSWERNRAGQRRPEFKRNQFGANVSGPLWKDKRVHFLFGYEGARLPSADSATLTVPTALERSGDFSRSFNPNGSLQQIFDPFTTRANPAGAGFIRDPFPENKIPASRFDPIAVNVARLFPAPNQPGVGVTNANNYFATASFFDALNRLDGRLDWAATEKYRTFFRVNRTLFEGTSPRYFNNGLDTSYDNSAPSYSFTWSNTIVPTPTWVINVMAGSGGAHRFAVPIPVIEGIALTDLGYSQTYANLFPGKTPGSYSISDYTALGQSRAFSNIRRTNSAVVNVNKERGAHSIKFGFSFENQQWNFVDERTPGMSFGRGPTTGPIAQNTSSVVGNSVASLLLGVGTGSATLLPSPAFSQQYFAWYAQDSWRATSRLTLTLGVRYELQLPRTERYDRQAYFDYDAVNPVSDRVGIPVRGGLRFTDGDNRGLTDLAKYNWAPRFGLSCKLTDRLVMRAGYGLSYWQTFVESGISGTSGFSATTTWTTNPGGVVPIHLLSNPFPDGLIQPVGRTQGLATLLGTSVEGWRRDNPTPYQQSYSVDFQYEVTRGSLFEIGYTGNQGRRLGYGVGRNFNQLPAAQLRLGEQLNNLVSNPFFRTIQTGPLSGANVPFHNLLRFYPSFVAVNAPMSDKGASSR
ncbi:MAG: TonB-dependent receptor domain-containing protein, partial [Gammaproteobacteria bacterium]